MNKSSLLFSALLGVATITAQAGELYTPEQYQDPAASGTSRAQVRQLVLNARANGGLNHNDVDLPAYTGPSFDRSRAEVKREVLAARANGDLDHNDVDLPAVAKGGINTRDDVRREYLASRKQNTKAPGRNTINY